MSLQPLLDGGLVDLVQARDAIAGFLKASSPQIPDAFLGCFIGDIDSIAALQNDASDVSVTGMTW